MTPLAGRPRWKLKLRAGDARVSRPASVTDMPASADAARYTR
jgi:hypothetical protein